MGSSRSIASVAVAGLAGLSVLTTLAAGTPAAAATCSGDVTAVSSVQGSGDTAAVTGPVTVRGVVVGDFEGAQPALRGFYLQDPLGDGDPATSDGIFVFAPGGDRVSVGDLVEVTGTAGEFQGQTQITAATTGDGGGSAVSVCGAGTVRPVDVRLPLASPTALERYEGMLVRLPQRLTVTEHFQLGRFGQVLVSAGGRLPQPTARYRAGDPRVAAQQARNDLDQLIIDDATNAQNPDPIVFARGDAPVGQNVLSAGNTLRGGDSVTGATGVLTYTWGGNAASPNAYRLRPIGALGGAARFVPSDPRPAGVPPVGGTLRVASSNLLNYFTRISGCTLGTTGAATDCRGAGSALELDRQAAKEVAALTSLHADVIGVMEMENDGYGPGSSIADLTARLNAATAPGTWAFVDVDAATGVADAAGTDAIKVGLLYRPARVTPLPHTTLAYGAGDPATTGDFERHPVAQTFRRPDGARFTVVVNHFKSKGCDGATGANLDAGDGQGCYNARRTAEAGALAGWIKGTVVPAAGDPDVLIIGDLNSYAGEDPIATLEAAGYRNLVADRALRRGRAEEPYSYVFDGQWGYLDHALASGSLRPQVTGTGDVHINADEPSVLDYTTDFKSPGQVASLYAPDRFRTSDHDPVVVGLRPRR